MNYNWLPMLAEKYQTEYCDQRAVWKHYLADYKLEPKALLTDGVHLNTHGEFLMAEAVKAHLRRDPSFDPAPAESWVRTIEIGKDAAWKDGKLAVDFDGARIDAIRGAGGTSQVRIDGQSPAKIGECHAFTRTTAYPGSNWPILLRVQNASPLEAEDWTLTLKNVGGEIGDITFDVTGSATGPDGSGKAGEKFTSNSGRVVIEPEDWNLDFCYRVFGRKLEEGQQVKWRSELCGAPLVEGGGAGIPGVERSVTLAQGLKNGKHTLELTGDPASVSALRVYAPPLK